MVALICDVSAFHKGGTLLSGFQASSARWRWVIEILGKIEKEGQKYLNS